jgi:hypothetical protein
MASPLCCNIVYNSEVLINEFHSNNYTFVLDKIPVSFLLSKYNNKCFKQLGPNPEDYARFNNLDAIKEANNDVRNLALFMRSVEIPGVSVGTDNIALASTADVQTVNGKMVFDTLTTEIQVDENFFIPRFFHYWLVASANPEELMKFTQVDYTKGFYTDGHLLLLDNNREKTIEIRFEGLHPKSISPIKLINSDPDKVFMTVTWIYTSFVFADDYKAVYNKV